MNDTSILWLELRFCGVECFIRFNAEAGVGPTWAVEVVKLCVQKLKYVPGRDSRNVQGQQQGEY